MRYRIYGKFSNGVTFSESCNADRLGDRIKELQGVEIIITGIALQEDFQEIKSYSWTHEEKSVIGKINWKEIK